MKLVAVLFGVFTLGLGTVCLSSYSKTEEFTEPRATQTVESLERSYSTTSSPESRYTEPALYLSPPSKEQVVKDLADKKVYLSSAEIVAFTCDRQEGTHAVINMEVVSEVVYTTRPYIFKRKHKERKRYDLKVNYEMQNQAWVLKSIE